MPIRPIDFISIPNRSQEASQIQHESIQRSQQAHSQLNVLFNKDVKHNSEQTVKTTKTENNEYRYDAKEQGNNSYQENPKKKQNKADTEKDEKVFHTNFDIKI